MSTWNMQASVSILVSAAASIMPSCLLLFEGAKSMQTTIVYAVPSAVHDPAGFCDIHSRCNMTGATCHHGYVTASIMSAKQVHYLPA